MTTILTTRATASTAGTALQAVTAAADLALMMNLVVQQIPDIQPDDSENNNRDNHCCHSSLLFCRITSGISNQSCRINSHTFKY